MKEYQTENLYLASFLCCRGFQFNRKERNGNKYSLVFPTSQALIETVPEFYAGGMVKAKDLFDWYRTLKDYIFSE